MSAPTTIPTATPHTSRQIITEVMAFAQHLDKLAASAALNTADPNGRLAARHAHEIVVYLNAVCTPHALMACYGLNADQIQAIKSRLNYEAGQGGENENVL